MRVFYHQLIGCVSHFFSRNVNQKKKLINNWLRNSNTVFFLEAWEKMHNPNSKRDDFTPFEAETLNEREPITIRRYMELTGAIGIVSKSDARQMKGLQN